MWKPLKITWLVNQLGSKDRRILGFYSCYIQDLKPNHWMWAMSIFNHSNWHRMKYVRKTQLASSIMLYDTGRISIITLNWCYGVSHYERTASTQTAHTSSFALHSGTIKLHPTERCCLSEKTIRMAGIKQNCKQTQVHTHTHTSADT